MSFALEIEQGVIARLLMASALLWLACGEVPQDGSGGRGREGLVPQALQVIAGEPLHATGPLATARSEHTATLLPDGKVLVAGGWGSSGFLASAEVYDPATGTWRPTGSMATTRYHHTATLLSDGKVLVAGGEGIGGASAEVYDPATGTWSPTGPLATYHTWHTATLLPDGKVLVAAGASSTAEVYDPATGTWSLTGPLATARWRYTATLLPDGKVLVAAGEGSSGFLASAEVYDPATGAWSLTGPLATARSEHTATLLPDGKVLVAGGQGSSATAELYDPATGTWRPTGPLATARYGHTAMLLSDAKVLVTGGVDSSRAALASAEVYDENPPPAAPVMVAPADGSATNTHQPTYSGTAEQGCTVTLFVDSVAVGTTTAAATGSWSLTPSTSLAEGMHTVKARATNAGGTSLYSNTHSFSVDTTSPAAPVVQSPANGSTASDSTPLFSGTAEQGSTVTLILDDTPVGTASVNAGSWNFTPVTPLAEGVHQLQATATDAAGNTSLPSEASSFTIDTVRPGAPQVSMPGAFVNTPLPIIAGTAEARSTVTVLLDGAVAGTALANTSGDWALISTTALPEGSHTAEAFATDAAGNVSPTSEARGFTVDLVPPATPEVTLPGPFANTQKPSIEGTAEARSRVTVVLNGSVAGTVTATASGGWAFTPVTALAEGPYQVTATAMDEAGNVSLPSQSRGFTVDTTRPEAPVITTPAASVNDTAPVIGGTAEPGSTVTVRLNSELLGTTTAGLAGTWSITPSTPLPEGTHSVSATAMDATGNISPPSMARNFTVDTRAPAAPEVTAPGTSVHTQKPTIEGKAEPNSTVTVSLNGRSVTETVSANAAGDWTFKPETDLAEGPHQVSATATDAAGNVSPASEARRFTVDLTAPGAPQVNAPGNLVNTLKPVIAGAAEASSLVTVFLDGGEAGTTTADTTGAWSFTPAKPLTSGAHSVHATATDEAGNTSLPSAEYSFTIQHSHYGFGCSTSPEFPAIWALLALAWASWASSRRSPR
jgi:WD40 repeat protein